MDSNELFRKAQELKSKGLTTYEIADALKVQADTVVWLLLRGKERKEKPAPFDVYLDWSAIGSHAKRISSVSAALADIVKEAVKKGEFEEPEVVVAVEGSGMALGMSIAEFLDRPFAVVRPKRVAEKTLPGMINPFFSAVENSKVLIVDAVVRAGETIRAALETLREAKAHPVAVVVLANKSAHNSIGRVPLKSLIELLPVSP